MCTSWPEVASDDPSVEVARLLAVSLREAIGSGSLRAMSRQTGVDHTTIGAILNGAVWPDLQTIARLEAGLGVALWPAGVAAAMPAIKAHRVPK